jgi:hypothetical protein
MDVRPYLLSMGLRRRVEINYSDKIVSVGTEVTYDEKYGKIEKFAPIIQIKNISDSLVTVELVSAKYNFFGIDQCMLKDVFDVQARQTNKHNCKPIDVDSVEISEGGGYLDYELRWGQGEIRPCSLKRRVEMRFVKNQDGSFRIIARDIPPIGELPLYQPLKGIEEEKPR